MRSPLPSVSRSLVLPVVLAATLLALTPTVRAEDAAQAAKTAVDVVVLTDGRRIQGEIVGQDDDLVSIRSGGVLRAYPRQRVASIEKAPRPAPLPASDAETSSDPASTSDVAGGRKKKDKKPARTDVARDADGGAPAPLSPAAAAWLDQLIGSLVGRTADADPAVVRSVSAAIRALGPAAAPRLEAAAAAATGPAADLLRKLAVAAARPAKGQDTAARRGADPMRGTDSLIVDRLRDELELDATQMQAVETAMKSHRKRQKDMLRTAREEGLDRPAAQALMAESRTTFLADVRAVLSDAQTVALTDIVRETMENAREKRQKPERKKKGEVPRVD